MALAYFRRPSAGVGPESRPDTRYAILCFVFVLRLFSERCCFLSLLVFTFGRPLYTRSILGRSRFLHYIRSGASRLWRVEMTTFQPPVYQHTSSSGSRLPLRVVGLAQPEEVPSPRSSYQSGTVYRLAAFGTVEDNDSRHLACQLIPATR